MVGIGGAQGREGRVKQTFWKGGMKEYLLREGEKLYGYKAMWV